MKNFLQPEKKTTVLYNKRVSKRVYEGSDGNQFHNIIHNMLMLLHMVMF